MIALVPRSCLVYHIACSQETESIEAGELWPHGVTAHRNYCRSLVLAIWVEAGYKSRRVHQANLISALTSDSRFGTCAGHGEGLASLSAAQSGLPQVP